MEYFFGLDFDRIRDELYVLSSDNKQEQNIQMTKHALGRKWQETPRQKLRYFMVFDKKISTYPEGTPRQICRDYERYRDKQNVALQVTIFP